MFKYSLLQKAVLLNKDIKLIKSDIYNVMK